MCTNEFSSYQQMRNSGLSIGIPIDGIPLNIGGHDARSDFQEWKKSACQDSRESMSAFSQIEHDLITADQNITHAWQACVTQPGLKGWIVRTDNPNTFAVKMVFNTPTQLISKVHLLPNSGFVASPQNIVSCVPSIDELNGKGVSQSSSEKVGVFGGEGRTVTCTRSQNVAVSFAVNASWRPDFDVLSIAAEPPPPSAPKPPEQPKIKPFQALFVGIRPGINEGIVGVGANFLGGPNSTSPIGMTIDADGVHDATPLFMGATPGVNEGWITTVANFRGASFALFGSTVRDQFRGATSIKLYSIVGGRPGCEIGEISPNPAHKNCETTPIGWTYQQ
jgi:hypothetical protein